MLIHVQDSNLELWSKFVDYTLYSATTLAYTPLDKIYFHLWKNLPTSVDLLRCPSLLCLRQWTSKHTHTSHLVRQNGGGVGASRGPESQIFRVILELDTVSYGACFKAFNYDLLLSGPRLLYSYEYIDSSVDNHPNHPQEMPKRFWVNTTTYPSPNRGLGHHDQQQMKINTPCSPLTLWIRIIWPVISRRENGMSPDVSIAILTLPKTTVCHRTNTNNFEVSSLCIEY